MPSQEYQEVVAAMQAWAAPMVEGELSLEQQRAAMESGIAFPMLDGAVLTPVDAGGVPGEWTALLGSDPKRRLLYLHGGGYVLGSIATHRRLVADIAQAAGCVALSLDYRLAPEHPYPAAVEDALAGLAHIWDHGPEGKDEADAVFVAGDSAGGGLTLALLLAARDRGQRLPTGAVGLSPWADLAASPEELAPFGHDDPTTNHDAAVGASQAWAAVYAGEADRADPLLSPVFGDYAGLPPLLLQAGSVELIARDTTRVAERARAAGVDATDELWPDMFHVWQGFAPMLPEGQEAIERIGEWIRARSA